MSERVGAIKLGTGAGEPFMGRDMGHTRDYSESVAGTVDHEVRRLVESAHDEAWEVLVQYRDVLDHLVLELLEKETLNQAELAEIFAPVVKRDAREVWLSSEQRSVSQRPPVMTEAEKATLPKNPQAQPVVVPQDEAAAAADELAARAHRRARPRTAWSTTGRSDVSQVPDARGCAPRRTSREYDEERARAAVRELLLAVGEDPDREGLQETPARVARAYREIFAGLRQEPADVLTTIFDLGHEEMVLVKDIEVYSTCEHHLVPFHGVAHVGYIPNADGRITGLSKLARLVEVFARRPQVQERLTSQIADALVENLAAARRDRRRRVRAPVHVHAGRAQAWLADRHLRGARPDARRRDPRRGHEPDPRDGRQDAVRYTQHGTALALLPELGEPDRTLVMGVVNVTPDSFSDGGEWFEPRAASRTGWSCSRRGRTSWTSGASPRGPVRGASRWRTSWRGSCP